MYSLIDDPTQIDENYLNLPATVSPSDQFLLKLNSLLKALHIEVADDVAALSSYFYVNADGSRRPNLIPADQTVPTLKRFAQDFYERKHKRYLNDSGNTTKQELSSKADNKEPTEDAPYTVVSEAAQDAMNEVEVTDAHEEYWNRLRNVVDKKHYRIWDVISMIVSFKTCAMTDSMLRPSMRRCKNTVNDCMNDKWCALK